MEGDDLMPAALPFDPAPLDLPEPGGRLAAKGATSELVREFARDYEKYHASLSAQFDELGGVPEAANFDDPDAYLAAAQMAFEIVRAEAFLRACRQAVLDGKRLDDAIDSRVPLITDEGLGSAFDKPTNVPGKLRAAATSQQRGR